MKKILIFIAIAGLIAAFTFYSIKITNEQKEISQSPDSNVVNEAEQKTVVEETEVINDKMPVLYNLGVEIDKYNLETKKAGDIIFTKKLIYDDGYISGNKAFLDFGSKEKYFQDSVGVIEYWFYVPLKTQVKAPISGKVSVSYFEHTKDWGININQEGSKYIVSFEHLINLNFKEGDIVNVGDVVGEAAPRMVPNNGNNDIAMVELAVWKGGSNILKFCPFDFLEESLKPSYAEKINTLSIEWEEFIDKEVYNQEDWVSPGCLVKEIIEK